MRSKTAGGNGVHTRVKPGKGREHGVSEPGARTLAQAPTLLSGHTSGHTGTVKVWMPQTWRIWTGIGAWMGICALTLPGLLLTQGAGALLLAIPMLIPGLVLQMNALRRPHCVITDDYGIAIDHGGKTTAIPWHEVESLARVEGIGFYLVLMAPAAVRISLAGYSEAVQLQLFRTIARRAHLHASSESRWRFDRS